MSKLREKLEFFFTSEKINIYIYTCSQLVSFLLAFLINLFFTKFANPTGYGEYKYATNFLLTVPTLPLQWFLILHTTLLSEYLFVAVG